MALGVFLFLKPLSQIKYRDIPIKKYKTVQTGPNIEFGGLKNGLLSWAYQVDIEGNVTVLPANPIKKQRLTEIISFNLLTIFSIPQKIAIVKEMSRLCQAVFKTIK